MAGKTRALPIDLLPERYAYRDDGCEVSPSCLRCPLPKCKYDEPGWFHKALRRQRDQDILRVWRAESPSVGALAARFGISQRTVFRALQRGRSQAGTAHQRPNGANQGGSNGADLTPAHSANGRRAPSGIPGEPGLL